jgi:hypothetical protein
MRYVGALAVVALVCFAACGGDDSNGNTAQNADGGSTGADSGVAADGALIPPSDAHAPGIDANVDAGACLGSSLLASLGKDHLMVGGSMEDTTASSTPIDVRYIYISGGLAGATPCASCMSGCSASWWGCWQDPAQPPGQYASGFVAKAIGAKPVQIPMITYYEVLQASGASEGMGEVQATNDATFMSKYYNDWRFLLQQIGVNAALLHIEPDFWGYAEQANADPSQTPSAVTSANMTDCGSMPNTIAGMGKCMIAMVRKYAPNAKVGLHASAWGTNMDVAENTNPSLDVAGEAKKLATFLAACGEDGADFVVVEASDRDAGYYQSIGRNTFWDDTNTTLPTFHQDLAWVTAVTEALGKPGLYWQIPFGNMSLPNVTNQWKDNRVDYFFAHMNEVAAAHTIGIAYGAGAGGQTTAETDNGNFVAKDKAYAAAGGQKLCP